MKEMKMMQFFDHISSRFEHMTNCIFFIVMLVKATLMECCQVCQQLKIDALDDFDKRPLFQDFRGRLLKVLPKAREKRPLRL